MDPAAANSQVLSLRIARVFQSGGRVSVPVRPSQTVFAQFRHISGTPASAGENTMPISRLRLLNRIVSMLQARKERSAGNFGLVDSQLKKSEVKPRGSKLGQETRLGRVTAGLVFNLNA